MRRRIAALRAAPDSGAAVAEFAMVSVLILMLLFAVLQVAVYFYLRNIAAASAATGARYAGALGVAPIAGGQRASVVLASSTGGGLSHDVACSGSAAVDQASGLAVVKVRCRGPLRLTFLPLHSPLSIDVTAEAIQEQQPR